MRGTRLVLVSNRLPVTVQNDAGKLALEPSSGGVATALRRLHERTNGVWIGWPGEIGRASSGARPALARELEALRTLPIELTSAEVAQYYDGFANGVLWPLFHYLLDKVDLDAERDFETYRLVNERFAERIAQVIRPGIWEFVASRINDDGVLIVSEFAGAAAELREAVLLNPYDIGATAAALVEALAMPLEAQRARMQGMRAHVRANDVHQWASRFMDDLSSLAVDQTPIPRLADPSLVMDELLAAPCRVLLLNYDGTLVPHERLPYLAVPGAKLLDLLARLAAQPANEVHVVTGRTKESIEGWLGRLPIALHAEHGLWWRAPGGEWSAGRLIVAGWKDGVRPVLAAWVARTPGAFLEEKTVTLGVHYRNTDPTLAFERLRQLREELRPRLPDEVELLEGAKILEVRLRGVNKGLVVARLGDTQRAGVAMIAIGDDRTDEDLFGALPEGAVTIRVGPGRTKARFRIANVGAVRAFLERFTHAPEPPAAVP